ncbi:MAG: BlaI/MecI/CopY family transcriptional regulator [Chitinophagales bacterium]|nr:BlaI/MecI/CopY family transcriptional regulator [Chitinophagales bacterium]HAE13810.1 transcriptional regulator [Bacteroidota bacterium]MCB9021487.1 BlaI/MecI/CopY family transcriptional regulator [Chitinophagales bacterium]MCB9031996.1 BlaI/MecI/CopY family transcriptional regulator [Chitinophagales bacterium]HAE34475.1 transcriptional regulator [Bacteroidota bacterium]
MKELTKAEEQVMQILWELEKGFIRDILERMPDPTPAYTTVSTIVRILETKGFVGHHSYGKTHEYFPLVSREEYRKFITGGLLHDYFGGSVSNLVSHFAQKEDLSAKELDEILRVVQRSKKQKP